MASPREIRRRIRSVRNMSQITRAMEMVSASKLRRAQERVQASRPYSDRLRSVIADLASLQLDAEQLQQFPLLAARPVQRTALILVTPDRGLTGALNGNILRRGARYIREEAGAPVQSIAVGKRGRDFLLRTGQEVAAEFIGLGDRPTLDEIRPIAQVAMQDYFDEKIDAVHVVFPRFVNTMTQRPEAIQVLPIERPEASAADRVDYIFEPNPAAVLQALLPRYIEVQLYQAILESIASEHSARMVAMRNATDNAKELVDDLSLSYNNARQAQITNEVAEIAAGANAFRV
ncbi:MAG: F0F1 ATP synthase subunit gamma [Chloroflexota bacterium]|nr:F0F1 ATP synthase subunit gamma [Chloroflexota bacterium]